MNQKQDTNFRPPIVTLMGHVDHGKTTLLDTIRKTNIAAREHGGITQHIGAYQIVFQGKPITFIDTPGHAAFEKMRSRGAQVADIIILVVAAGEGVKPQTTEAIAHIKKSQRPTVVAITKIDLPDINIEKVKSQLQKEGIIVESFGGQVPVVQVAAPKNKGVHELLEVISLLWQLSPAPNLPQDALQAVVVESYLDKSRGPIATLIVKKGTLKTGQKITVDSETITVKAQINDQGQNVSQALPSTPVQVLGFKKILDVGSIVTSQIQTKTSKILSPLGVADIIAKAQSVRDKFKVIIKADATGSLEAILSNLPDNLLVISQEVGEVTENDIAFAKLAHAPILTFNLKTSGRIISQALQEGVVVKNYHVIYELLADIEDVVLGFEQAKKELKILGRAKIVATFNIAGKKIAGALVTHGRLKVGDKVTILHNNQAQESQIISLKRFKKDTPIVTNGQDCGVAFDTNLDFDQGDIIESLG